MTPTPRDLWEDLRDTARRHAERRGGGALEAALLEPGLVALAWFRFAHWLHERRLTLFARLASQQARRHTGIWLHPGARIGRRCLLLDGGAIALDDGVVLGDDCEVAPGTLVLATGGGAPRLGDRVVLEPGCRVVGGVFVGHDVRVAAGAVVSRDVPDGAVAVGVPGRVVAPEAGPLDPDARAIAATAERLYHLEEQLQVLAFSLGAQRGGLAEQWRTRQPKEYGPIAAVEALVDGAGI